MSNPTVQVQQAAVRIFIIIAVTVIALGLAAYFYWIGSPFYAFQQAAIAAKDHDRALFDKYVDAPNIIDHFLDDLLVQPALSTPHLSSFQTSVASGALTMAKSSVTKGLMESINKYFQAENTNPQQNTSYFQTFGMDAAIAAPTPTCIAQGGSGQGLKELLHTASHVMSGEVGKLKSEAYNRMIAYIQNHPNSVPGRLLDCPPNERSAHAKAMLEEYGLTPNNFKGVASCDGTTDLLGHEASKVGFNFFSPKINKQIVVVVEIDKDLATGVWHISRLLNIKDVMDQVEENYDRDIHELVEYSLSGMSNSNMATDMRGMTDKIKESPAAQNLFKKWNLNFH